MLPSGLTTRPLVDSDARAVYEVQYADEQLVMERPNIELADILAAWQRPSFDLADSTVGVFEGERLVGYAELEGKDRGEVSVHPDRHGRGIGTWLADWILGRARERGGERVGMHVLEGSPGDLLLSALGFEVRWTSWILELPAATNVPARDIPAGFGVREAAPEEHEALHRVIDDAFLEWSDREPESFADFVAEFVQRPGFEPWQLRVAVDPTGTVVGGVVLVLGRDAEGQVVDGYVQKLGVRRDQRGLGLAQALLADAFGAAFEHGAPKGSLATDTRTGALGLYEKVGMSVVQTWLHRARRAY